MKVLTPESITNAAMIEGYLWECAEYEVKNKNKQGAIFFLSMAEAMHQFCDNGHEDTCITSGRPDPQPGLRDPLAQRSR